MIIVILNYWFLGYNEPWLLRTHFASPIQLVITEFDCIYIFCCYFLIHGDKKRLTSIICSNLQIHTYLGRYLKTTSLYDVSNGFCLRCKKQIDRPISFCCCWHCSFFSTLWNERGFRFLYFCIYISTCRGICKEKLVPHDSKV